MKRGLAREAPVRSNVSDRRGVAFRTVARTRIDAEDRIRHDAWIDATPREPRPDMPFGDIGDRPHPNSEADSVGTVEISLVGRGSHKA
jgi:hypothetical protein